VPDEPTWPRPIWALVTIVVVAVLVMLQAKLVGSVFTTPLQAGDDELPVALEPLLRGPGPVAAAAVPDTVAVLQRSVIGEPQPSIGSTVTAGPGGADSSTQSPATAVLLAGWATELGAVVGVPAVALAAYGAAQLEVAQSDPGCRLSWPTLAGIGWVESDHGRYAGAVLGADGRSTPPIIGIPLDGRPGVARIADSDGGRVDGDPVLDRAVGPLQFIPTTWERWGVDADGDGVIDPFDIDDAALAAAQYLCEAGGDLSTGSGWTRSIYAYNASDSYVLSVRGTADQYAAASQQGAG